MNRREFLEAAVLAAAAPKRSWSANDKVNVAIVGVGGRGLNHLTDATRREDINLTAVCDVNTARTEKAVQNYYTARNVKPKVYADMRKLYEDKEVDAVVIATPNHWHALATIWACQAGKHVYVEKPASYNPFEGERMTEAARKTNRCVQVGTQRRSVAHKQRARELLQQGVVGKIYMARGLCYKRRKSMGHRPDGPVPPGLDWDLFLGPAPMRAYNANRHAYGWHYFWDTGNGDIGNQGIHEIDYARWVLGKPAYPNTVYSGGGKYIYDDDQETPNIQTAEWDYGDCLMTFEVRGLPTGGESEMSLRDGNFIGILFYGEKGYMVVEDSGFKTFLGDKRQPGESMARTEAKEDETVPHMNNFLAAIRSGKWQDLRADIREGAISADLVHMANASYRTGRRLTLEKRDTVRFAADDEANRYYTRHPYRAPYVVV
jgi:predicted dehydrogenase